MNGPKLIGRYEIVAEIGRGAMGSVFKARDPAVGRIVALKTVHATALAGDQSQEYRARFYREARASGVLAHPGIVPVFDVGEHEGAPFLVMEFVDGRTLADAVKKGERFSLDRVCEFGQQIAEALGYAHRQGVIHRDIKPANILLTSREVYGSERPRITDFGIAKLMASEITTMGQLLGTPSFMPPEQFTGTPVDGRADLFSLGVILYALATGEQPFAGETMTAVSYKVVYTEPIPPIKLNPAISPRLEAAILKSLAKSPADRFQTGEELAQELVAIRSGAASAPLSTLAPVPVDADATLAPYAVVTTGGFARTGGPAKTGGLGPAAASVETTPPPVPAPTLAGKQQGKKVQVETLFAAVLLAIVGLGTAAAATWFVFDHFLSAAARAHRQALTTPNQPPPQPVVQIPQPSTTQASSDQTAAASPAPDSANTTTANNPNPPAAQAQPGKSNPATPPAPVAPTKPGATSAPPAKAPTSKLKTPTPPAQSPVSATPTPAAVAANAQPAAPAAPTPAPSASATSATNAAAAKSAPLAFDPRKLDPNTSTKLKVEPSKLPNGLPINIELDRKQYLSFITGDKTDLDNLYIPAGVHELRVQIKTGGQEFDSNIVSDAFKAKKKKTLKIEILQNGKAPASIPVPLTKDMSIFLSFPSIFDL